MRIETIIKYTDKETYKKLLMLGGNMGTHSKSNRETRKKKYQEQFARTEANKKRKAEKRKKKLER